MPTETYSERTDLMGWLTSKPREVVVVYGARAALRAAPLLVRTDSKTILTVFRAIALTWVAGCYPRRDTKLATAAANARAAVTHTLDDASRFYENASINALAYRDDRNAAKDAEDADYIFSAVSLAANAVDAYAAPDAALKASNVADGAYRADRPAANDDKKIIDSGVSASALAARQLWLREMPTWVGVLWRQLEEALLTENLDWQVWTDWYRDRLEGRRANEALEVARVLIAEEIWKQGPRAVNAEIARLIAEHSPEEPGTPEGDENTRASPPEVPAQRPAAVEPIWGDHLLTLPTQPVEQDLGEAEFISALGALRNDLREFVDDLGETNIDRHFLLFVRRLADRIPDAPPSQIELFRLGHIEEAFHRYATTVDNEWPTFLSVRYGVLMRQYERTMGQSPLWREFKRNAEKVRLSAEQIAAAVPLASAIANALRETEALEVVDAVVPAAFEDLIETAREVSDQSEAPFNAVEAENELLAEDLVESVNNVLKPIAEAALAVATGKTAVAAGKVIGEIGTELAGAAGDYGITFAKGLRKEAIKQAPTDAKKAFKWLRRLSIAGAATGAGAAGGVFAELGQLIAKFPQAFEWLERVLHFIK